MYDALVKYCQLCNAEFPDHVEHCPDHGLVLMARGERDRHVGRQLKDTYTIEELIGAGGMGRVYRAIQSPLQRSVAIKIVEPTSDGSAMIKRFYREARLLASIAHANVVTIFDFGNTDEGMFYLVMEYLRGRELNAAVPAGQGLEVRGAVRLFDQICQGVNAAHSVGMVHRDLKPNNIFLAEQTGGGSVVKVVDFGLAKVVGEGQTMLTRTGMLMGTPGYVAPELIGASGDMASVRSDIYAMGAILYFLLTGEEVHAPGTSSEILARQLMEKLDLDALTARGDVDGRMLQMLILKAMSFDPADRHETCTSLLEAFRFATSTR